MPEKVMPGPVQDTACIREAVCIHTKKIYDSCKDKDCIEDLRFYPTQNCQAVIDRAISIKAGKAELLYGRRSGTGGGRPGGAGLQPGLYRLSCGLFSRQRQLAV